MLDVDSRLRVAHGIGKNETEASLKAFQTLQQRCHSQAPPPMISDGWGGIDDALLAVYGRVPQYAGRGRPPSVPRPGADWLYLQMVKQRDERGRLQGTRLKAVWGNLEQLVERLGTSTAYIERSNLTTRLFSARLTRKTLAFSKAVELHAAAVTWENAYYNWIRPHKSLRAEIPADPRRKWAKRTPAMAACLTDHIWTVKELLFTVPLPRPNNTS